MLEQPLLTPAELAFIHHLHQQPSSVEKIPAPGLHFTAGKQLDELLSQCAANEQLSIHAQVANEHLTFDLHLSQDEQNGPSLQIGAPQIFDEGEVNRAWRSPLPQPLPLHTHDAELSDLWIHQLSMNGALIEYRARRKAPKRFSLMLPLDTQTPIAIEGVFVRQATDGLLAYQLQALDPDSDEHLRQFIYQQHRQQQQVLQRS